MGRAGGPGRRRRGGLWLSVLGRPADGGTRAAEPPRRAWRWPAVLERLGVGGPLRLKWPNDLMLGERKCRRHPVRGAVAGCDAGVGGGRCRPQRRQRRRRRSWPTSPRISPRADRRSRPRPWSCRWSTRCERSTPVGRLAHRRASWRELRPARLAPRARARGAGGRHRRRDRAPTARSWCARRTARRRRCCAPAPSCWRRPQPRRIFDHAPDARHRQHRDHRGPVPRRRARGALAAHHQSRPHARRVGQRGRRLSARRGPLAQRSARRVPRLGGAVGHPGAWSRASPATTGCTGVQIDARSPLPVRLDVDEPLSVGADRIVNALAAVELYRRGHDRGRLRHGDHLRLRHRRRPVPRRGDHAGPPHRGRPAHPAHRQAAGHRAARARARHRAPHRGVHPGRACCSAPPRRWTASCGASGRSGRAAGRPRVVATGRSRVGGGAAHRHDRADRPRPHAPRAPARGRASRPRAGELGRETRLPPARAAARLPAPPPSRRVADHGGAHGGRLSARGRVSPARPPASGSAPALLGLVLWVVCLNGGTLALNSAFDRDEGDIAYLRRPPLPPRHLAGVQPRRSWRSASSSRFRLGRAVPDGVRRLLRPVAGLFGAAAPAQGGGGRRLDHQHVGLRHPHAVSPAGPRRACRSMRRAGSCCSPSARCSRRSIRSPSSTSSRRTPAAATARSPACSASARSLDAALVAAAAGVRAVRRGAGSAPDGAPGGTDLVALGRARCVALGAWAAVLLPWRRTAGAAWRRPITSGACTGRSAPGRSPTSSSCSAWGT